MHLLRNSSAIDMGDFGLLEPGEWLCSDQNAFELAILAERGSVALRNYAGLNQPLSPKSHLLVRSGAWGDLLFLTPVMRELRKKHPGAKIGLSNFKTHHCLFDNTKLADELLPYPVALADAQKYEAIVSLENAIELAPGLHATDAFAKACGIEAVGDYRPAYQVSPAESEAAWSNYPKTSHPRLGIQMFATGPNRNYPGLKWVEVIRDLLKRGWEIYALGTPRQMARVSEAPLFKKITLPFRESAAFLKTCDAFCGVDSVWLHMCHALDLPAVGLYGPFAWQTRTGKAPLTRALSGVGPCAPCNWHTHAGRVFPPAMPCAKAGECSVLAGIEPSRIVAKVDALRPK